MSKIEMFNTEINQSVQVANNERYHYKNQVMSVVQKDLKQLGSQSKACIIGAGKLSDVDITIFLRFFDELVLSDIDTRSIYEELKQVNLDKNDLKKIHVVRIEYTGFELAHFFDDFKERIVNCHTPQKVEQVLESKLQGIDRYQFFKEEVETFDFIMVSPIYTQLIYNQVLRECSLLREMSYPEHLIKTIEDYMLDQMIDIINRFNRNIIKSLSNKGHLMVLSDIFQLDVKSSFYSRVSNAIHNFDVMEEIYDGYKDEYGMGLGDYGLFNLDEELLRYFSKWLIWPFTKESHFIVKLNIYKKKTKDIEEDL